MRVRLRSQNYCNRVVGLYSAPGKECSRYSRSRHVTVTDTDTVTESDGTGRESRDGLPQRSILDLVIEDLEIGFGLAATAENS